jgi:hypothetical protein
MRDSYHQEIKAIVSSLRKQEKNLNEEKLSIKLARYFGYGIGFFGNAIVPYYTYQFGKRVSNYFLGDKNPSLQVFLTLYFAIVPTITLGSLGVNVCGEMFPETLQLTHDNPFKEIKLHSRKEKTFRWLGFGAALFLSIISNIPGTYLTDKAYREMNPLLAVIFDIANQIAWSTVSAWSLYAVPEQIYKEFVNDFCFETKNPRANLLKKLDQLLKTISVATEQELFLIQEEFFPDDQFTNDSLTHFIQFEPHWPVVNTMKSRLRKLIGVLGMVVGMVSIFYYYPIGKSCGEIMARLLNLEDQTPYIEIFMGVTNYSSQATLAILSTKYVFGLVYDRIGNLCITKNPHRNQINLQAPLLNYHEIQQPKSSLLWPKIKAFLYGLAILFFAITASSYRAELTAEYVPDTAFGMFLIAISAVGASCLGSWSLDRLAHKFKKTADISPQSKLTQRMGLLRLTVDKMDDQHLKALIPMEPGN